MEDLNKLDPTEHRKLLIKNLEAMINLKARIQGKTPLQVSTEMALEAIERKISQQKNNQHQNSEPYPSNRLTDEEMKVMKEGFKKAHREIKEHIRKKKKD